MMHLITILGSSARKFYLKQQVISDFKSLISSVTSGRVMIISTKFRSDLFYKTEASKNNEILKLWALYAHTSLTALQEKDITSFVGEEKSLSKYFLSINNLSSNWYHYRLYKKAFRFVFFNDQQNPVARTVMQCDQFLIAHTNLKRAPLTNLKEKADSKIRTDTFALVMHLINKETLSN